MRRSHAGQHLSPHVTNTLLKTETVLPTEGGRWACGRIVWLGHRLVLMDLRELSWSFFVFFFFKFVTFIYLCAAGGARVEIRRQLEGIDFLLPPRGFPESSWGCQAWLQGSLPIESSEFCPVCRLQTLKRSFKLLFSGIPETFSILILPHKWPSSEFRFVPLLFKFTKCIRSGFLILISSV